MRNLNTWIARLEGIPFLGPFFWPCVGAILKTPLSLEEVLDVLRRRTAPSSRLFPGPKRDVPFRGVIDGHRFSISLRPHVESPLKGELRVLPDGTQLSVCIRYGAYKGIWYIAVTGLMLSISIFSLLNKNSYHSCVALSFGLFFVFSAWRESVQLRKYADTAIGRLACELRATPVFGEETSAHRAF